MTATRSEWWSALAGRLGRSVCRGSDCTGEPASEPRRAERGLWDSDNRGTTDPTRWWPPRGGPGASGTPPARLWGPLGGPQRRVRRIGHPESTQSGPGGVLGIRTRLGRSQPVDPPSWWSRSGIARAACEAADPASLHLGGGSGQGRRRRRSEPLTGGARVLAAGPGSATGGPSPRTARAVFGGSLENTAKSVAKSGAVRALNGPVGGIS